jgi:hypothetical protein
MKKFFLLLSFLLVVLTSCAAQTSYFAVYDDIGVVSGGKIQLYRFFNGEWRRTYRELSPPNGFRRVFGVEHPIIGCIVNNKVELYMPRDDGSWENVNFDTPLVVPNGSSKVFPMDDEEFGVVVNNEVIVYRYTNNDMWEIDRVYNFNIPLGYKDVFYTVLYVNEYEKYQMFMGVVFNNRVIFYQWWESEKQWVQSNDKTFYLPHGYQNVISMNDGFGMVFNNRIERYGYQGNNWVKKTGADFMIK